YYCNINLIKFHDSMHGLVFQLLQDQDKSPKNCSLLLAAIKVSFCLQASDSHWGQARIP
ncbi:unnamed protein product, partial [Bubo scandiacus]